MYSKHDRLQTGITVSSSAGSGRGVRCHRLWTRTTEHNDDTGRRCRNTGPGESGQIPLRSKRIVEFRWVPISGPKISALFRAHLHPCCSPSAKNKNIFNVAFLLSPPWSIISALHNSVAISVRWPRWSETRSF